MARLEDVMAVLDKLTQDVAAERGEVQAKLNGLLDQVQGLKDQLAQGQTVTPSDLDAVVATISAISLGVQNISEPDAAPLG